MKKFSISLGMILGLTLTINTTFAEIQSPIFTDDIGRSHFLGRGGYSTVRQINMQGVEANAVNDAINYHSNKMTKEVESVENEVVKDIEDTKKSLETDITNVIKEKTTVPVSSKGKATYTPEMRKLDASAQFGQGMTNLNSGVNDSKTIYTDDLGRLHFFGRANQIKE
jgi:hypothetical protein